MDRDRHLEQLAQMGQSETDFFVCKHCGADVYAKGVPTPHGCLCNPEAIAESKRRRLRNISLSL